MDPLPTDFIALLGKSASSEDVRQLLTSLNTAKRPSIEADDGDDRDDARHFDWILVRRKGIELGFADRAYVEAEAEYRWGEDENLVLNQLTFFNAGVRDEVQGWQGALPYGLEFSDTRVTARAKLVEHEATRRSGARDCWDIGAQRLVLSFLPDERGIATVHVKTPIKPWDDAGQEQPELGVEQWFSLFGESADGERFREAVAPLNVPERIDEGEDDREVSFLRECGIELYFEKRSQLRLHRSSSAGAGGLAFAAVKFFRARDREARQWTGELPLGLDFDHSIDHVIATLHVSPVRREEGEISGFALWHFSDFSLHLLYSTIDNHLLRINMMAPGYWREPGDGDSQ